jgi:hypothetical protein
MKNRKFTTEGKQNQNAHYNLFWEIEVVSERGFFFFREWKTSRQSRKIGDVINRFGDQEVFRHTEGAPQTLEAFLRQYGFWPKAGSMFNEKDIHSMSDFYQRNVVDVSHKKSKNKKRKK